MVRDAWVRMERWELTDSITGSKGSMCRSEQAAASHVALRTRKGQRCGVYILHCQGCVLTKGVKKDQSNCRFQAGHARMSMILDTGEHMPVC